MNDKAADRYVGMFFEAIESSQGIESKKRTIRLLVKEVERDTRHKAADLAQAQMHAIMNMEHPE